VDLNQTFQAHDRVQAAFPQYVSFNNPSVMHLQEENILSIMLPNKYIIKFATG
jgi:hypothetical protein